MRIPDRTGVIAGYRVWRVIPGKWVAPSESLYAQTSHRSWSLAGPTVAYCPPRPGGPEQAAPRGRLRVLAELRLRLRALRPLRTDTGGVPPPLRRRVGAGVGPGGAPRGALFLQGREGPSRSLRPAARGRGNVHQERSGGQVLPGRRALGGRGGGGAGGAARVHGGGGEQVVAIGAGGEEKPEREEVVEPLEESRPERHKERREERVREEEPEKVPA